ncbi:MAG: ATP-binding protein, partial [Hominilimicola sp.]
GALAQAGVGMFGRVLGAIAGSFLGNPFMGSMIGGTLAGGIKVQKEGNVSGSASVNMEYLDKFAQYAEETTDHHVSRLMEGRNLGFWNTGVYVLGEMPRDIITVTGMLRSIYSGDETYFEPIRLHLFRNDSHALEIVRNRFELLPLIDIDVVKEKDKYDYSDGRWHILGKRYQYVSTPLNTKELSLTTSLPRRDVPGLRFVKTAVRFANNPAIVKEEKDKITIGNIVDTGITQSTTYDIDVNSLVRHTLIAGSTGSGKSTTCKRILSEVLDRDIPIMVIEPAKDDYVRWAIGMNKRLPKEKQFKIYMPGVDEFEGCKINELKINLYEPAAKPGEKVDILQHSETAATLLNACLPADEVVPILIEEVVYETIREFAIRNNIDIEDGASETLSDYPDIDAMLIKAAEVMDKKSYADINRDNLTEVLVTRFKSLKRGMRGRILNVTKSVDYEELFSGNVIINISRLAGSKDKALIMSLLLQALYEYRISRYANDADYRKDAQENKLKHLMLIEEAHNVFIKPDITKSGDSQKAAADLFGNMLSEVRGYGQGFIVVDQVPTRLIDDAVKNTNYKIVHRLTAPDDQEVMASCIALRDDQKYIIPALECGHAIICGDKDDAAAWVKVERK